MKEIGFYKMGMALGSCNNLKICSLRYTFPHDFLLLAKRL